MTVTRSSGSRPNRIRSWPVATTKEKTMTLTLTLPPELEERLKQETRRQGVLADDFALRLLDERLPPRDRATELVDLLQSWIDEDDSAEQKATGQYLVRALDEDRTSERKLFPEELKGVSW
jgi:hypothetical protein